MNNKFSILAIVITVLTMVTSCLKDDDTNVVYYDDAAITSFSLGTLNRTMHKTTKNGKDSVYTTTVSCSKYAFTIDQAKGLIYNIDSLPEGTIVKKSLVNVSTLNSGYVFLKSLTSDSLSNFVNTDSLDFSVPRTIRCVANNGQWYKDYTVEVRVHKENANTFYWEKVATNKDLAAIEDMKAFVNNGRIYVYGMVNNESRLYMSSVKDGVEWTQLSLPSKSPFSVTAYGTCVYALADGTFYSTDPNTATFSGTSFLGKVTEDTNLKALVAATKFEVYAISNDNKLMMSNDGGKTWNEEKTTDDFAYLPTRDINGVIESVATNSDIDKVVLIGNRDVAADKTAMVWSKVVDNGTYSETQQWMYQPFTSATWHHAPALDHVSVTTYNNGLLMLGGKGINGCTNNAFDKILYSRDNGQNWWNDSHYFVPEGFESSETSFAITSDSNNCLWIICGQTGQVWRGYLSDLTWD